VRRSAPTALSAIVAVSFVARTALAWLRAIPAFFPDEYTYAALGRSIAESGHPLVRGASAHFPALLEPIVTAPAWLVGDVTVGYRLVQTIGALAMSLAAVPAYLLARRLGLSARVALALAALAVLMPDLVYSSFVTSEALTYPLLLTSVYTAVRALTRPTGRAQLLFLAAASLTAFARIQFAVLPVVYVVAAAILGLVERRPRAALREQRPTLTLLGLGVAAVLVTGPSHALGAYRGVFDQHVGATSFAHWVALDAMTLAYAAGWVIVPGALLGIWLSVARPRSRDELAFGITAVLVVAAVLIEAGVLQATLPPPEIQERYIFYAGPLLATWFALYASRGWPLRVPHLALAAALVVVSMRLPLTTYSVASSVDASPVLYGVYWLTGKLGRPGDAAAVVAAAAAVMSAFAVLASRRPRLATPLVLGLALVATGVASAGAVAFDVTNTRDAKARFLPADPSWVDDAGGGEASLLQAWGGSRAASFQELFWNRSISRLLLLPNAFPIDRFGGQVVQVGPDGALLVGGEPISERLVVDGYGSTIRLRGADLVRRAPTATLWLPVGRARLALYATGRYYDGWLADRGAVFLWPDRAGGRVAGYVELRLTSPGFIGRAKVTFSVPGGKRIRVALRPDSPQRVRIPVCSSGRTRVGYFAGVRAFMPPRFISVKSTAPVFRPDRSACDTGTPE